MIRSFRLTQQMIEQLIRNNLASERVNFNSMSSSNNYCYQINLRKLLKKYHEKTSNLATISILEMYQLILSEKIEDKV